MQISVPFRRSHVYGEGGKTEKDAHDNVRSFLLHFSAASLLGDMYRNHMLFLGICVVLIWENCEHLLKRGDWQCVLLFGPVEAVAYESFPLQLCQHSYLNQLLQLPQYSWFLHCSCVIAKCFSVLGETSKGWEGLLFWSHPWSLGRC